MSEMEDGQDKQVKKAGPKVIVPPNTLRKKVGPMGPGGVDTEMLARAEEIVAGLSDTYIEWVQEDLATLDEAFRALREDGADAGARERMFRTAHDVKGQGGSFGYDLVTVIGNSLCRFLEQRERLSPAEVDVVRVHLDSLKLVVANRIEGDGGKEGDKLLKGLDLVVAKVSK
jgi:chemotaxis protein histidine kinase CheA